MRVDKALNAALQKSGIGPSILSVQIGKSEGYVRNMLRAKAAPRIDTFSRVLDSVGWDLLIRDRDDGFEITIDPPIE